MFSITNAQIAKVFYPHLFCEGNLTYSRADLGYGFAGTVFLNLTVVATYTTTAQNKLISGDAYAIRIPAVTALSIADQEAYIEGLCKDLTINPGFWPNQTNGFCSQADYPTGYYANYSDCVAYMHSIPFGDFNDVEQKTVICCGEHRTIAFWRPSPHCGHAGKDDPVHCTYHTYERFYQQHFKKKRQMQQFAVSDGIGPYFADLVRRSPPLAIAA